MALAFELPRMVNELKLGDSWPLSGEYLNAEADLTTKIYIDRWPLTPEGDPITTRTSCLLPISWRGVAAMLKIAADAEEERANEVMAWWDGQGVPLVRARDGKAILLERAPDGSPWPIWCNKAVMTRQPESSAPSTQSSIHPGARPTRSLSRFRNGSEKSGLRLTHAGAFSRSQLRAPMTSFRVRVRSPSCMGTSTTKTSSNSQIEDWLAIDPKGLIGERGSITPISFAIPIPRQTRSVSDGGSKL